MRFMEKVRHVEAVQFTDDAARAYVLDRSVPLPEGVRLRSANWNGERREVYSFQFEVVTWDGTQRLNPGEWVVTEIDGDGLRFAMSDVDFRQRYDPAPAHPAESESGGARGRSYETKVCGFELYPDQRVGVTVALPPGTPVTMSTPATLVLLDRAYPSHHPPTPASPSETEPGKAWPFGRCIECGKLGLHEYPGGDGVRCDTCGAPNHAPGSAPGEGDKP